MNDSNPYESPGSPAGSTPLGLRDHLICIGLAALMWFSSAAVMSAFVFGIYVAFSGPYRTLNGDVPGSYHDPGRPTQAAVAGIIVLIASSLSAFTFYRVQQSRRRTGASLVRREALTRAVDELRADVRRRKAGQSSAAGKAVAEEEIVSPGPSSGGNDPSSPGSENPG